ncbi:MAG: hypothetical protein ACI4J8_02675 [Oscillospiraceae bacterium]
MSEGKKSKKPVLTLLVLLAILGIIAVIVNANTTYVPLPDSSGGNDVPYDSGSSVVESSSAPKMYRPVSYEDLSRDTDGMKGKFIKVKGEITQVMEDDTTYQGRIAITYNGGTYSYYSDNILFVVPKSIMNVRLLENDIVTFCGQSQGLLTYTSVMGSDITSPCIYVEELTFENSN